MTKQFVFFLSSQKYVYGRKTPHVAEGAYIIATMSCRTHFLASVRLYGPKKFIATLKLVLGPLPDGTTFRVNSYQPERSMRLFGQKAVYCLHDITHGLPVDKVRL